MSQVSKDPHRDESATVDPLLHVNSKVLRQGAETIRESKKATMTLHNGVEVSAAQLEAAANLLADAEPSVITGASGDVRGVTLGVPQERPGFIHVERQVAPDVLTFDVGIFGSSYHIDRDGTTRDVHA